MLPSELFAFIDQHSEAFKKKFGVLPTTIFVRPEDFKALGTQGLMVANTLRMELREHDSVEQGHIILAFVKDDQPLLQGSH